MSRLPNTVTIGRREIDVPVNAIDQLINWINPERGNARFAARIRQTALGGGYQSADRRRTANRNRTQPENDADGNILPDLPTMREDSQHLLRNSPIAAGAVATNVTRIVGTGLKVRPEIDRSVLTHMSEDEADAWEIQARNEFNLATDTREIDIERQLPFSLLQAQAFYKTLEDGDIFVNLPRISRVGSPYQIKIQMIEAARVCNKDFATDTAELVAGVKKDQYGAPTHYHVLNRHPGNYSRTSTTGDKWDVLTAFGAKTGAPLVLHLLDKKRPGQTRGVPYLTTVVELIKQLGRYTDAEVMAAVVTGFLTVAIKNQAGDPNITMQSPVDSTGHIDTKGMELGPGAVIGLMPGEDITTVNPNRPNPAFDPFMMAVLRQIGAALELPFELLVKHFTASYSAAKAALEEAKAYFMRRRHWLATQFCQPIYEAVITEAIASGRLAAPGFFTNHLVRKAWLGTRWTGDAFAQLDPVKEISAATARINARLTTLDDESIALTGTGWEPKVPQMAKERRLLKDNDLLTAGMGAPVAAPVPDNSQGDDQP